MAFFAQRLVVGSIPEKCQVAAVGDNVVNYLGGGYPALALALGA